MSTADRGIRLIIACVISLLFFLKIITGTVGIVLLVVALVFLVTSLISFCPLYAMLNISTCKRQ